MEILYIYIYIYKHTHTHIFSPKLSLLQCISQELVAHQVSHHLRVYDHKKSVSCRKLFCFTAYRS